MSPLPINKSYAIGTKHNKIVCYYQFYYYFHKSLMMTTKEGSLLRIIIGVTLTLLLCFLTAGSKVLCIESERHALQNFKQDLKDPSNRLASCAAAAASDEDCCDWVGVVCHNRTGHVLQLHLTTPDDDKWSAFDLLGPQWQ